MAKNKPSSGFAASWRSHAGLWSALFISALAALIYSNTYGVTPRFDDSIFIFDKIQVRDIARIWTEGDLYRKIPYLTFALNYRWTGQEVWSWHLVNLLFHIAASLAVFGIAGAVWRSKPMANHPFRSQAALLSLFTGLIFACHPIQTSAVTYIYQRMIVIATLFHVLTLYGYLRARVDGRRRYWLLFAAAGVLACFTKQVNLSLPLTLVLTEAAFGSDSLKAFFKRGIRFLPFALIPAALYAWTMKIDFTRLSLDMIRKLYPLNVNSSMTWAEWVWTQLNVMRTYLRLLVFPMNQNLDYEYAITQHPDAGVYLSVAVIAAVLGLGVWCWRRHRPVSWGIFFMAAALSLEFFAIRDIIFEHRLYLPMVGFAVAAPAAVFALTGARKRAVAALLLITTALSVAAFSRNALWADEEKFWLDGIRKAPSKGRPYYSLGVYYAMKGEHGKAVPLYTRAIEIWPNYADAYCNLGKSLEETGHMDKAIFYYAKALQLDPTLPEALNNFGSALVRSGRQVEARGVYEEAMRRRPDNYEAMNNMGSTYAQLGEMEEAEKWYRKSIEVNPLHAPAHSNLASVLAKRGDMAGAEAGCLEAIRLDADYFDARYNLALLYIWKQDWAGAEEQFAQAVRIRPQFAEGYNNLGSLMATRKEYGRAEQNFRKAIELQPTYKDAIVNLANTLRELGRQQEAETLLADAKSKWPQDARILEAEKKLIKIT